MLQLSLQSLNRNNGNAEMYIDYQDGVGFTVIVDRNQQYDFSLDDAEWDSFKMFIDKQIYNNTKKEI